MTLVIHTLSWPLTLHPYRAKVLLRDTESNGLYRSLMAVIRANEQTLHIILKLPLSAIPSRATLGCAIRAVPYGSWQSLTCQPARVPSPTQRGCYKFKPSREGVTHSESLFFARYQRPIPPVAHDTPNHLSDTPTPPPYQPA